jgi:hypothetical protein
MGSMVRWIATTVLAPFQTIEITGGLEGGEPIFTPSEPSVSSVFFSFLKKKERIIIRDGCVEGIGNGQSLVK